MRSLLRNGRVVRLSDVSKKKCMTIDLNKDEVGTVANVPDKTLLWVLIALGVINLIKK